MGIAEMRTKISKVYPGEGWAKKVRNMHSGQVLAVYHSFLAQNKFEGSKVESKPERGIRKTAGVFEQSDFGEQISLDEYMLGVDLASGPDTSVVITTIKPEEYDIVKRTFYFNDNIRMIVWCQDKIDEDECFLDYYDRWLIYAKSNGIDLSQISHDHKTEYISWSKEK